MQLFAQVKRPDAIFCANDLMALGAMDALRHELGLRIPEDVAIVGFDDIDNARWPVYELTTVRPQVEKMVDRTLQNLLEQVTQQDKQTSQELLPGDLIIRRSAVANTKLPEVMATTKP